MTKHPMQPLYLDVNDTIRFRSNKIVERLLAYSPLDLNDLARMTFTVEDREQFTQLIGYSVCGFGELSYVSDEGRDAADEAADVLLQKMKAEDDATDVLRQKAWWNESKMEAES